MNIRKPGILHYMALTGVLAVALFFRAYNIGAIGYGNMYYASTVFSMLTSWKNFFFGSFDPAGFVTVDKPPLGFWVQTASAAFFGFEGWALMLPQIVAGTLACLVLYWLVRRIFGPSAGLIAALILAVTPIAVAADRNNTIDGQLLLVLLLSAAALMLAVEKGSLKWLVLGAALIGVGFNIKMLQAYLVLPAFYGLYFLAARTTWLKRIAHLAVASVVLIVISFAWVVAVDAIPADQRPYIGSSENNTVMELIEGHNGLRRMGQIAVWLGLSNNPGPNADGQTASQPPRNLPPLNQNGQPQGGLLPRPADGGNPPNQAFRPPSGQPPRPNDGAPNGQLPPQDGQPPRPNDGAFNRQFGPMDGQPPVGGPGGGLGNETGTAGALRLFNEQLVGQVTWLLPLALLMMAALALRNKFTWPLNAETQFALFWGLWLIPMAIFFSYAGLFHRYYLEMLAPAVAALVAAGLVSLTRDFMAKRWQGWLLPLGILGSAVFEATVMIVYWGGWAGWAAALTFLFGAVAGLGLILMRSLPPLLERVTRPLVMLGLVALLAAPVLWSSTLLMTSDTALPHAGPDLLHLSGNAQQPIRPLGAEMGSNALTDYLVANYNGETFIVAGMRAGEVAPIIIQTDTAAMAIGGFSGSDPILSADEFAQYVANGEVRFVLAGGNAGPSGGNAQNETIRWVQNSCSLVTDLTLNNAQNTPPGGQKTLYDCRK